MRSRGNNGRDNIPAELKTREVEDDLGGGSEQETRIILGKDRLRGIPGSRGPCAITTPANTSESPPVLNRIISYLLEENIIRERIKRAIETLPGTGTILMSTELSSVESSVRYQRLDDKN